MTHAQLWLAWSEWPLWSLEPRASWSHVCLLYDLAKFGSQRDPAHDLEARPELIPLRGSSRDDSEHL